MIEPNLTESEAEVVKDEERHPAPLSSFLLTFRHAFRNPVFIQFLGRLRWVSRLASVLEGRVLDIGCGHRPFNKWYTNAASLVSIDFRETSSTFKGLPPDAWADPTNPPFGDRIFDNATCWWVIEHLPEPKKLMDEAWRVLKPGGLLF